MSEIDAFMDYVDAHEFSIPPSLRCIDLLHRSVPPSFRKEVRELAPSLLDLLCTDRLEELRVAMFFDGMSRRWLPSALEVAALPGHLELRSIAPIQSGDVEAAAAVVRNALQPLPVRGEELPETLLPTGDRAGPAAPDGQPSRLGAVLQAMHAVTSARRASIEASHRATCVSRSDYQVAQKAIDCAYSASMAIWYGAVGHQAPVDELWRDVIRVFRAASSATE